MDNLARGRTDTECFLREQRWGEFGLGDASVIDEITVYWPSGIVQIVQDVAVDQVLDIIEARVTGDYDGDGRVDSADYDVWRNLLGATVSPGTNADGNVNGTIDQGDFALWQSHFGMIAGPGTPGSAPDYNIPEPDSVTMVGLGTLLIVCACSCWCDARWLTRP